MKGQRRGRNAQSFGDRTSGEAIGTGLDQQPKGRQAMLMGQSSQCCDGLFGGHGLLRQYD